MVETDENATIVMDVRKDLDKALKELSKARGSENRSKYAVLIIDNEFSGEIRTLRKELIERERKGVNQVISGADVILATNVGAGDRLLKVTYSQVENVEGYHI